MTVVVAPVLTGLGGPIYLAVAGLGGAVFLIALGAFYPIVVNTAQGARDVAHGSALPAISPLSLSQPSAES